MGLFNSIFGRKSGSFNTSFGEVPALPDAHVTPANLDISKVGALEFPYADKHMGADLFDQEAAKGDIAFSKQLTQAAKRTVPVYKARIKALKAMGKVAVVHGQYVKQALTYGQQVQGARIGIANHAASVQQRLADMATAHQKQMADRAKQAYEEAGKRL